jgi:hypothetical protein
LDAPSPERLLWPAPPPSWRQESTVARTGVRIGASVADSGDDKVEPRLRLHPEGMMPTDGCAARVETVRRGDDGDAVSLRAA